MKYHKMLQSKFRLPVTATDVTPETKNLYIKIDVTYTSKFLILRQSGKFLQISVCLYLLKAMYVSCLRRSMSVSVSSNVPRYLHFFQSFCVCSVNCMLYFFFFSFIVKFRSSKIRAIFFIALSMMSLLLLINPMSSAYCWSFI